MATEERGRLVYQDDDGLLDLPAPKLFGRHQFENAGVAIAALRAVARARSLPLAAFETGIAKADWPARMQRLSHGTLAALRPGGQRAVARRRPQRRRRPRHRQRARRSRGARLAAAGARRRHAGDQGQRGFLRNFTGLARRVIAVPIPHQEKSLPADAIAEVARARRHPGRSRRRHRGGARRASRASISIRRRAS